MSSQILVLNAGSSSIKFAVFNANKPLQRTVLGMVSGIGSATAFSAHDDRGPLSGTSSFIRIDLRHTFVSSTDTSPLNRNVAKTINLI